MLAEVAVAENIKTVEFTNIKNRGSNPSSAAYSYSIEKRARYDDLLLTVKEVDPMDLAPLKQAAAMVADDVLINLIASQIKAGVVKRMALIKGVSALSGASNADVGEVITRYTGEVPDLHRWFYKTGARGAHLFELLDRPATETLKP